MGGISGSTVSAFTAGSVLISPDRGGSAVEVVGGGLARTVFTFSSVSNRSSLLSGTEGVVGEVVNPLPRSWDTVLKGDTHVLFSRLDRVTTGPVRPMI